MTDTDKLFIHRILALDRHLRELSKNFSDDVKDWRNLRIRHREEIQFIGLRLFTDWDGQRQEVAQLIEFHKEKCAVLKLNQSYEIATLDELLKMES